MVRAADSNSLSCLPMMSAPICGCRRIWARSSSVSGPGLSRMLSDTPILPTSCKAAVWNSNCTASGPMPACCAIRREMWLMRTTWLPVSLSLNSAARPSRRMICWRVATSSEVRCATMRSSSRDWSYRARWVRTRATTSGGLIGLVM